MYNFYDSDFLALLLGILAVTIVVAIIFAILYVIAYWRLFTKAGIPGWWALIPGANGYMALKMVWAPKWFFIAIIVGFLDAILFGIGNPFLVWLSWLMTVALLVISIIYDVKLAKAFNKSTGFAVGLIFLNAIFILILAFGNSQYVGNVANTQKKMETVPQQ